MRKFLAFIAIVALLVGGYYVYQHDWSDTSSPPGNGTGVAVEDAVKLYQKGEQALQMRQPQQAREIFEDVTRRFPDTWGAKCSWLQLGDIYLSAGEDHMALKAFQNGLPAAKPEHADAVRRAITELKKKLAHDNDKSRSDTIYVVRAGDTLSSIARRLGTRVELIKLANNKLDDNITAGQTIHVSFTNPEIIVERSKYILRLYWKGRELRRFPVGIGKNNSTPVGEFRVETKLIKPDWYRDHRKIPYGHPDNILGSRWLGMKGSPEHSGYGIHGTTRPETVPGATSAGCVRMINTDIEELFEWVPLGAKIIIK